MGKRQRERRCTFIERTKKICREGGARFAAGGGHVVRARTWQVEKKEGVAPSPLNYKKPERQVGGEETGGTLALGGGRGREVDRRF